MSEFWWWKMKREMFFWCAKCWKNCRAKRVFVRSAEEALSVNDLSEYDLILLDMVLPGMSGWKFTEEVRQKGLTVYIVALSAAAMQEEVERAFQAGVNEYITKPYYLDAIRNVIAEIIENKKRLSKAQPFFNIYKPICFLIFSIFNLAIFPALILPFCKILSNSLSWIAKYFSLIGVK